MIEIFFLKIWREKKQKKKKPSNFPDKSLWIPAMVYILTIEEYMYRNSFPHPFPLIVFNYFSPQFVISLFLPFICSSLLFQMPV